MKLKEYIKERGISVPKAAGELGITREYLYELISERKSPGKKLIVRIMGWSQNIIKLNDLWNLEK